MQLPFRFFLHPRSPVAAEKLTALLVSHGVSTSPGGDVRSIEVNFTEYAPAYLVPEAVLAKVSIQPYATEIWIFYQAPGQKIQRLGGTAAKVTKRPLLVE